MAEQWVLYDDGNPISDARLKECIRILRDTAAIHRDLDFVHDPQNPDTPESLKFRTGVLNKINSRHNNPHHPANNGHPARNWMKFRCYVDGNPNTPASKVLVVVVYHLWQHRGKKWGVSIGLNSRDFPNEFPAAPASANAPLNSKYVNWAKLICRQLNADLENNDVLKDRSVYSIDDRDNATESRTMLRTKRIGELLHTFENVTECTQKFRMIPAPGDPARLEPVPKDHNAIEIKGWARPGKDKIRVTEFRLR